MGRFLFSSRSDASDKPSSDSSSNDWISKFFHQELQQQNQPQVITLTFHRASTDQRLGVKLAKRTNAAMNDVENVSAETDEADAAEVYYYVAALDEKHDSLLNNPTALPIEVGDTVVSFNDVECGKIDLETLQETMSKTIGVITIRLVKADHGTNNSSTPNNRKRIGENQEAGQVRMVVQQAIFVQPKEHTCLPMDLDFESQIVSQQRCLTIVNIHSSSHEENVFLKNNHDNWLSPSCLEVGQIILAINGSCSYNLEEDDARVFLHTKCELEPCVSITTLGYQTTGTSHDPEAAPGNNTTGRSKNQDGIQINGKENESSEPLASKRNRFPNIWSSPANNGTSSSSGNTTKWSFGGRKVVSKEDEERKEQRKLDAQYIQESTAQIQELINQAKKDHAIDTAGKLPMFASCRKLFVGMKHRMDACTRERGVGEVYFQLYLSLSKDFLSQYSQILQSILTAAAPSKTSSRLFNMAKGTGSSPTALSSFSSLKGVDHFFGYDERTDDNERILCHIVNTSKFCADTIEQMEEMTRNTIDDTYAAKIDMTSQQEVFDDIAAKAMEFLVSLLGKALKRSAFANMAKLSWKNWDHVQDTNDYVYSICHHVEVYLSTAETLLSPAYFCTLCDKVAMDVIESFDSIMLLKCNQTTTTGKQQLLLDVHTLKSFFLGKLVEDHKKGALVSSWAIYEKMVSEKFQKMEALLRVASVSESDLKDFMDDII